MYSNLRDAYRIYRQCHGFIVVMLGDDHIFQGGAADETGMDMCILTASRLVCPIGQGFKTHRFRKSICASLSTRSCRALTGQRAQQRPHQTLPRFIQLVEVRVLCLGQQIVCTTCLWLGNSKYSIKRRKTIRTTIWTLFLIWLIPDLMVGVTGNP